MKKLSFLILLCTILTRAMAATFSGTVTNATLSGPQVGQKVYLHDTMNTYIDSAVTNSSGAYSFTIPGSVSTSGNVLSVVIRACGASYVNHFAYTGANLTYNVTVCPAPPAYTIDGAVWDSLGNYNALAKVYLIGITAINPSTSDTTIAAIDSFITNSSGLFHKSYTTLPTAYPTCLRLKAMLLPTDPQYANYLPTYYADTLGFYTSRPEYSYRSTLSWSAAKPLSYAEITGATSLINMIQGTNPGGPGFIGGSVLLGAGKSTAAGDPLSQRVLILTKSNGKAVAYTRSNASGQFSFPSVPLGTYYIFGDALGKSNPALTVTVTSTTSNISNIVFEENSDSFVGHLGALSVAGNTALNAISVFPNPAADYVRMRGLSAIHGDKTAVLLNVTGTEVSRQTITKDEAQIAMNALTPGVYLLQVHTTDGTATFRIVK